MKRFNWQIYLAVFLILLSVILYLLHFYIFRDSHHIFIYLLGDIAFVPIEVLLVTIIIHQLLNLRERRAMLEKLNMVIGAFFSEVGTYLLKFISDFDPHVEEIKQKLIIKKDWTDKDFRSVRRELRDFAYKVDSKEMDLASLKNFLSSKRGFLLRLLENPNLLEHEYFTDLLWAVFHATEELIHRKDVGNLPDTDYEHLSGDVKRMYRALVLEWVDYMLHLRNNYPYLFSLSLRTNPFDEKATPEVS
ncbi:MAG: hypothetical protein JW800_02970 [Candidatus Omnitrophica bacterium]|nr:hypothetical protein [Candidatus Omnitrophota bacterium]